MFAGMAKLVDALDLGSSERSWGFESLYPHQKKNSHRRVFLLRVGLIGLCPTNAHAFEPPRCGWRPSLLASFIFFIQHKNPKRCKPRGLFCFYNIEISFYLRPKMSSDEQSIISHSFAKVGNEG